MVASKQCCKLPTYLCTNTHGSCTLHQHGLLDGRSPPRSTSNRAVQEVLDVQGMNPLIRLTRVRVSTRPQCLNQAAANISGI